MEQELKNKVEQTFQVAEENNKILKQLRRNLRMGYIVRGIYWLFILGAAVSAYYFAQPYVEGVRESYTGIQSDISNFNSILKSFGGGN